MEYFKTKYGFKIFAFLYILINTAFAANLPVNEEEGVRWRHQLRFNHENEGFDLEPAHIALAQDEIIAVQALRNIGQRYKNVANASFSLLVRTAGNELNLTPPVPLTSFLPNDNRPIIFESGRGERLNLGLNGQLAHCSDLNFNHPLRQQYRFIAGNVFNGQPNLRQTIQQRFNDNPFNHNQQNCPIHQRCVLIRNEQQLNNQNWNLDYKHSEQFILRYLSDNVANIYNSLTAPLDIDSQVLAVLTNIHTRFDLCSRCAPSISRELNIPNGFFQNLSNAFIDWDANFPDDDGEDFILPLMKVFVSSRSDFVNQERRYCSAWDGGYLTVPELNAIVAPYFIQVPLQPIHIQGQPVQANLF